MIRESGVVDVRSIAAKFPTHSLIDERHEPVIPGTFERDLLRSPRPLLLHGIAQRWTAFERWTFEFLAREGKGVQVVATKSVVETARTRRATVDLGDYVRSLLAEDRAVTGGPDQTYVSFLPLFEVMPQLKADIPMREVFGPLTITSQSAWIGPAGTITGLHTDNFPNLLTQLRGRKGLILFPPSPLNRLYLSPKFETGTVLSAVDLREPDWVRFPRLRELVPIVCILEAGDAIYIPAGWWHYVVSETPSISLTSFAGYVSHVVRGLFWQAPLILLHLAGLYKRGNCICHNPTDPM
jgi:lysine-specific demethylase 8